MGTFWDGFEKSAISYSKLTDAARRAYSKSGLAHHDGKPVLSHKRMRQAKKFHEEAFQRAKRTGDVTNTLYVHQMLRNPSQASHKVWPGEGGK